MKFPELNDSLVITARKINDINTIKSKIESQLHTMKAKSIVTDNLITFSILKFYMPSGSLKDRNDSLKIIKEGTIVISKEGKSLKISWSVKLDSLYFLALCCSGVAGLAASLYLSTELVFSLSIGIAFFLMFVFLGILFIKYKLSDLIESSVYPNYN